MNTLLDLVFPPRCSGCGRVDTYWCRHCQVSLNATPLLDDALALSPLEALAATALHTGAAQHAVHGLKYDGVTALAAPLSDRLFDQITRLSWVFDVVVPVPLHADRERSRGYNQAWLLAEGLAQRLPCLCSPLAVSRQRNTRSQVGLSAAQRRANLDGAFLAQTDLVQDQVVLLVDDVFTTGATLRACAEAVLQAGARAAYGITVTVAQ